MPHRKSSALIAGRLALDFANLAPSAHDLSWEEFVSFLVDAKLVSEDRALRLQPLLQTEAHAVDAVILRILRLRESLRAIFCAIVNEKPFPASWVEPVNEILRITEGHDELISLNGAWSLQFVARESGLEWLLAAIPGSGIPPRRIAVFLKWARRVSQVGFFALFMYFLFQTGFRGSFAARADSPVRQSPLWTLLL